eukprot:TRINITY_DN23778_c0_g1_i2.p1 TRINITY_DN23778_c0_g1~~TRINITY_DN23778_c0_g1_i2.p1  ORF type:complete len:585 (-),score=92.38 TRINITY_DN23778_c0_g1_i2:208-1962(-)
MAKPYAGSWDELDQLVNFLAEPAQKQRHKEEQQESLKEQVNALRNFVADQCDRLVDMIDGCDDTAAAMRHVPDSRFHRGHTKPAVAMDTLHLPRTLESRMRSKSPLGQPRNIAFEAVIPEDSAADLSSSKPLTNMNSAIRVAANLKRVAAITKTRVTKIESEMRTKKSDGTIDSDAGNKGGKARAGVFLDIDSMKEALKKKLAKKPYNVTDLYWETGIAQHVARSPRLDSLVGLVIVLNSIWLWVDTDYNNSTTLATAEPIFIFAENLFLVFFLTEWLIRFFAFKSKRSSLGDGWFMFDTFLVCAMIFETWILTIVFIAYGEVDLDLAALGILRVVRLLRMFRMARLLRIFPELAVIIRAMRSAFWMLVILSTLIYAFAIIFTQLLDGKNKPTTSMEYRNFRTVEKSMSTLLLTGAFPDQQDLALGLDSIHFGYYLLLLSYLFLAALTMLNMLTGTLVEVVRITSRIEQEELKLMRIREEVDEVMQSFGWNIEEVVMNKAEFFSLLSSRDHFVKMSLLGIDVPALLDAGEVFFQTQEGMTGGNLMQLIFSLRAEQHVTVKDLTESSQRLLHDVVEVLRRHAGIN